VFATFFNDPPSRWMLQDWGFDSCMWSNDYPHPNSTWPHSREVIARDLGHLTPDIRKKLLSETVSRLYAIAVEELQAQPSTHRASQIVRSSEAQTRGRTELTS